MQNKNLIRVEILEEIAYQLKESIKSNGPLNNLVGLELEVDNQSFTVKGKAQFVPKSRNIEGTIKSIYLHTDKKDVPIPPSNVELVQQLLVRPNFLQQQTKTKPIKFQFG